MFSGLQNELTLAAKRMLQVCVDRMAEKEDELMRLEKRINPLLDDDAHIAFSFILSNVVSKLMIFFRRGLFVKPGKKQSSGDECPMDLETISYNVNGM